MNLISIKANKDINSDKIALILVKKDKTPFPKAFLEQLRCKYL